MKHFWDCTYQKILDIIHVYQEKFCFKENSFGNLYSTMSVHYTSNMKFKTLKAQFQKWQSICSAKAEEKDSAMYKTYTTENAEAGYHKVKTTQIVKTENAEFRIMLATSSV